MLMVYGLWSKVVMLVVYSLWSSVVLASCYVRCALCHVRCAICVMCYVRYAICDMLWSMCDGLCAMVYVRWSMPSPPRASESYAWCLVETLAAAQRKINTRDESIVNVGIGGRSRQAGSCSSSSSSSSSGAVRAGRDRYLSIFSDIWTIVTAY
jgi:hypothetical protein